MLILGLDFETTGLDSKVDVITEVGAVLWDATLKTPVKIMGYLVKTGRDKFDDKVVRLTGITPEMCEIYGHDSERALKQLLSLYQQADYICAHNGSFDRGFLRAWIKKHEIEFEETKYWIDTKSDIMYPPEWSRRLVHLSTEHGFLNPFPHRAVFDVMSMLRILSNYDINEIIQMAASPTVIVKAIVSYADNDKARSRGYHAQYENGRFVMWSMNLKECLLEKERAEAGFPIEVVGRIEY